MTVLFLFKIELLHTWYGLSDVEVEDQVNDLLSFSRFAGLGMEILFLTVLPYVVFAMS